MSATDKGYVYDALVKDENDFVGKVAYSLYKEEKIDLIKKMRKKAFAQDAIDQKLKEWRDQKCVDSAINNYRNSATHLVKDFIEKYIKSSEKDLEKRMKDVERKEAKIEKEKVNIAKAKYHGFGYGVGQSIVGSFAFSLLVIVCAFIAQFDATRVLINKGLDIISRLIN